MAEQKANTDQSIITRQTIIRSVITIAVLVTLYLLIRRLSGVLLPFLISFVVAYILAPIVNFFQHKLSHHYLQRKIAGNKSLSKK